MNKTIPQGLWHISRTDAPINSSFLFIIGREGCWFDECMDCELTNEIGKDFSPNVSDKRNSSFLSIGDIDEDVVENYLEGVGGSDNILDAKWLLKPYLNKSDGDSSSSSCYDETLKMLGGFALQEASREYGMK
ncbi:hypothetical protein ACSQ67_006771 [Phaseolus vulgaris]